MKTAIIIPARYGSTRFPGKPLADIAGKTMLERVVDVAREAAGRDKSIQIMVATEDERIFNHAEQLGVETVITPANCLTGSDRALSAVHQLYEWPDLVINLQGDAPFTPPDIVRSLVDAFRVNPRTEVVTPVHRLSWEELDALRAAKQTTPFSGTTAVLNERNEALWFSKTILPAMRNEDKLRESQEHSPVWQHIGLYGYRVDILEKFCELPQGHYEKIEGLEQLRLLENGVKIQAVPVRLAAGHVQSGIDSPEDVERAEAWLRSREQGAGAELDKGA